MGHAVDEVTLEGRALSAKRRLNEALQHAAHLLPAQGPITTFVHHNTLQAFEDLPFDEAVQQAGRMFGCQPYLPEDEYRQMLERGRIRSEDLWDVLLEDLGEEADRLVACFGTRLHLRLAMLKYPLRFAPDAELRWLVAETDALQRFRPEAPSVVREQMITETRHWVMRDVHSENGEAAADTRSRELIGGLIDRFGQESIERWSETTWEAFCLHLLWRICHQGVHALPPFQPTAPPPLRHRDWLLQATGEDSDHLVNEVLIRFCAAFLDQGFARWKLPQREQGFFQAFAALYGQRGAAPQRWLRGLRGELKRLAGGQMTPSDSIIESLELLGIAPDEWEAYVTETLLALGGWAGMIWQLESRPGAVVAPPPPGTLVEFLAVRLILERLALAHLARESLGADVSLKQLRHAARTRLAKAAAVSVHQRAFAVFQLAQVLGWKPVDLYNLPKQQWTRLVEEIETFSRLERRRIFHAAFERRYNCQLLDAVMVQASRALPLPATTRFQLVCCLDDREESFRRHLEEIAPDCQTYGMAGFFGVAMYYRGAGDAHYRALCPAIVTPTHYVQEVVGSGLELVHRRRQEARRALGSASHRWHLSSRTFLGGILTALVGSLASIPMVARIVAPRMTAQISEKLGRLLQPPPRTQLQLDRSMPEPGPEPGHVGYTVAEMADIVERVLQDLGLLTGLSRLVIFAGHGSSSLNNPHESAYNCGACAGGRGGPNARAIAQMANDPRVRKVLAQRGLELPSETYFLGAYHNTCNDQMTYHDLDQLPKSHQADFQYARQSIDEARRRNAHERCRRFQSTSLSITPEEALRHVEGRAEDLSQARPEYNHATNAVTIVGRRQLTRGLFLDRRAFLNSYDPTQDDEEHTVLARILQAAVPVCAGISLEYYFSCVDPVGWGCGSKLPHNITSLLGVMEGAASDLRTGLSTQMIEIHEPLRQLFLIETTPEAMLSIIECNERIRQLCQNEWVYLATIDPDSMEIQILRDGRFVPYEPQSAELPEVNASADWYRGWRDHLGPASIVPISHQQQQTTEVEVSQ